MENTHLRINNNWKLYFAYIKQINQINFLIKINIKVPEIFQMSYLSFHSFFKMQVLWALLFNQ